ncbi:MAG: hypothetical protein AAFR76_02670 [Planctomycetota bacterium]
MKWWHGSLIGLGIAAVMVLLTLPITLYIAIDKITNELRPASVGVFGFWIAAVIVGTVGGGLVPKLLGSVDRDTIEQRRQKRSSAAERERERGA